MRNILLILLIQTIMCSPVFSDDEIFPPDPVRSIEDRKMKPMVSRNVIVASGSNTPTSESMMNRGTKNVVKVKPSAEAYKAQQKSSDKSKTQKKAI